MKKLKKATMWFIAYDGGVYVGGYYTRSDAIWRHCADFGCTWAEAKKRGDYAIKCTVRQVKK